MENLDQLRENWDTSKMDFENSTRKIRYHSLKKNQFALSISLSKRIRSVIQEPPSLKADQACLILGILQSTYQKEQLYKSWCQQNPQHLATKIDTLSTWQNARPILYLASIYTHMRNVNWTAFKCCNSTQFKHRHC